MTDTVSKMNAGTTSQSATLTSTDAAASNIINAALEKGITLPEGTADRLTALLQPSPNTLTTSLFQDIMEAQRQTMLTLISNVSGLPIPLSFLNSSPGICPPASLPSFTDLLASRLSDIPNQLSPSPAIGSTQSLPTPSIALAPPQAF